MTIIQAKTQDQVLLATLLPKVACNNINTVKLRVEFDSAWDGLTKTAVFYTSNDPTPYPVSIPATGECTIPHECLAYAGYLYISIRGDKASAGTVKSTTQIAYKILPGTPSLVVSDPSPSVYQQLANANAVLGARMDTVMSGLTVDSETADIRVGADGVTYASAGEAVRGQIAATYRYPFIVLHGTTLVNFDTTNKTVTVPTFRAIGKEGQIDVTGTTLTFATSNGINVVYFKDGALGICMSNHITTEMQPIFSFNAGMLVKYVGCTLPVANYSVDGRTYFDYQNSQGQRYYNNGFLSTKKIPVAFDTVDKTVTISKDFRLQGAKQHVANEDEVTLPWDLTGSATNYVYERDGALVCSSTAPTVDDVYLFAFYKGKLYLDNRSGCTLPANLYTVDGQVFAAEKVITFNANSSTPIEITENTKIYGNGYELNLGTPLNGTRVGNIITVEYTPTEGSHFHNAFVSRTEGLTIETSRPYYNVTIWAFNDNKYEAIRLTPYLTQAEVETNDNSFTYDDGIITIHSANYKEFVLASEEQCGISINADVHVEIHDLKVLFARGDCVDVNAGHVRIYNCEFGYSTTANGLAVARADCDTIGCKAYYNRNDGFNYHYSGHSTLIECEGYNNLDDGVSHHENCTFEINGGMWMNNGKGGVASPTYGAKGRISNVVCYNNTYGIYAIADDAQGEPAFVNGAVLKGNTSGIYCGNYRLNVFNSTLTGNKTPNVINGDGDIAIL